MHRSFLVILIVTIVLAAGGCSGDVSQQEYDDLVRQIKEIEDHLEDLGSTNQKLEADIVDLKRADNELRDIISELTEELDDLRLQLMRTPAYALYRGNIERAITYLESKYNPNTNLVFEAQGPGGWEICPDSYETDWTKSPPWKECRYWTMDKMHWLGDSGLAWMALQPYNPEMSENIRLKLEQLGYSEYASSDLPDILSEQRLKYQPPRIQKRVYIDHVDDEYLIVGGQRVDDLLLPIEDYADVMLEYSINAWRDGDKDLATQYLDQVLDIWNGTGFWDGPAIYDNEAAIYKLALLLITVQILDYSFPYFHQVEQRIWENQDTVTGGIKTGIKPDGSIGGGPNNETTSLVILIYDEERIDMLRKPFADSN